MQKAQNQSRSKLLGEMPMNKLVPKISVPIMISMMVQALYNVVDSIFVARYDPDALTAVSLAYPIQMLMIALSVGMGVGINSLISRKLGEKNIQEARSAAWNGIFIEACSFLIFLIVGLFLAAPCMNLFTSESLNNAAKIRELGTSYLSIVCTFSFGVFMSICFERMLQSTGNTMLSMITQLTGAVCNIVLDPILINTLDMGIQGAAIATVISQWVSMLLGFTLNQLRNTELRLRLKEFRLRAASLKGILAVGIPCAVMQSIASVMNVAMNAILSAFPLEGNAAVNVLNIYFKLQSFVFMPVFGLGSGMVAIVGYNFGARLRQRVYDAIKVALRYAIAIMLVGTILFLAIPGPLMSLFEGAPAEQPAEAVTAETVLTAENADAAPEVLVPAETAETADTVITALPDGEAPAEELPAQTARSMSEIGIIAMRIICIHFIFAAIGITLSNVFQAIGKGNYGLIMSLCRQLVVLVPTAWLLSKISLDAVWYSFLIAELVSLAICLFLYRRVDKKMLSVL